MPKTGVQQHATSACSQSVNLGAKLWLMSKSSNIWHLRYKKMRVQEKRFQGVGASCIPWFMIDLGNVPKVLGASFRNVDITWLSQWWMLYENGLKLRQTIPVCGTNTVVAICVLCARSNNHTHKQSDDNLAKKGFEYCEIHSWEWWKHGPKKWKLHELINKELVVYSRLEIVSFQKVQDISIVPLCCGWMGIQILQQGWWRKTQPALVPGTHDVRKPAPLLHFQSKESLWSTPESWKTMQTINPNSMIEQN